MNEIISELKPKWHMTKPVSLMKEYWGKYTQELPQAYSTLYSVSLMFFFQHFSVNTVRDESKFHSFT